jgi:1-phosphofructokinase family hexose kinase
MVIAGPNPSVDRVLQLDQFAPGRVHRAAGVETRLGGGGVNAARTIARLGEVAVLVTILPDVDEAVVLGHFDLSGIRVRPVRCSGITRVGTILRERDGRLSVFNEPGATVGIKEWEEFRHLVSAELSPDQVLLCTGSIPPGVPLDGYARLAREARQIGARCVVDASGETLAATIEAGEAVVVPNLAEAETILFGHRPERVDPTDTPDRARQAADGLLLRGAHIAVVTAGSLGVAVATSGAFGATRWIPAPSVELLNPIGAGDTFAAAIAWKLEAGAMIEDAAEFAVVIAAAYVASPFGGAALQEVG